MDIVSKNTPITLGSMIFLGLGLWFLLQPTFADHYEHSTCAVAQPNDDETTPALQRELAQLRTHLARLEDQRRRLSQELRSARQVQAELVMEATQGDTSEEDIRQWASEMDPSAEESRQDITADYERYFWQEREDSDWSRETEGQIVHILESTALEDSDLMLVDCRSTLCRLEVSHDDDEAQLQFLDTLPLTAPFDAEGFYERIDDGDGFSRTVVYLARVDHQLPALVQ